MEPSPFTHAICELCWSKRCKAQGHPGRNPIRVVKTITESCCFCGYPTMAGIYLRAEPTDPSLMCKGTLFRHAELEEAEA